MPILARSKFISFLSFIHKYKTCHFIFIILIKKYEFFRLQSKLRAFLKNIHKIHDQSLSGLFLTISLSYNATITRLIQQNSKVN